MGPIAGHKGVLPRPILRLFLDGMCFSMDGKQH